MLALHDPSELLNGNGQQWISRPYKVHTRRGAGAGRLHARGKVAWQVPPVNQVREITTRTAGKECRGKHPGSCWPRAAEASPAAVLISKF